MRLHQDYFCGQLKGRPVIVKPFDERPEGMLLEAADILKANKHLLGDACEYCVQQYIWKEPPIRNFGCFLEQLKAGYCKEGVSETYRSHYNNLVPFDAQDEQTWIGRAMRRMRFKKETG